MIGFKNINVRDAILVVLFIVFGVIAGYGADPLWIWLTGTLPPL